MLDGTATEREIKELNSLVDVVVPKDKDELKKVTEFYSEYYPEDSLNWLDVSMITDMSELFSGNIFYRNMYNGDISKWNTSNVTDMNHMFYYAVKFDQPISNWDTSNVKDMNNMFCNALRFNQHIDNWDVSCVIDMNNMFNYADKFNQNISNWDVSNVINMYGMFDHAESFN